MQQEMSHQSDVNASQRETDASPPYNPLLDAQRKIQKATRPKLPFLQKMTPFRICALVLIFLAALPFVKLSTMQKTHAATWNQIFNEDFNGAAGSGLNTANWKYDTGTNWGTGEIENMTSNTANVQQDGSGHLKITALRDGNGNWTSGRIETQRSDFAAPTGGQLQVSATVQQPDVAGAAAAGYWPAFWMLGAQFRADGKWPSDGEIDMMEDINGLSSVFGTLHCGVSPGGPCHEKTGISSGQRACPGCQTSFHTYSLIVDRSVSPEQIRWYLDGNNYFTIKADQFDATTWANAVDRGFFVIFDLAMGGDFPNAFGGGPNGATQSGASLLVENVQVSTMNGGGGGNVQAPTLGNGGSGPYYKIINRQSGQALDISGLSTANGGSAIQWPYHAGANQQWQLISVNGGYKLVNRNSGLVLDDPGYATTNGTPLDQWSDTNGYNQWWNLVSAGNGCYYLVNQSNGLYVDVSGGSTANGATVLEWPANSGANQQWQIIAV